jgi:hypothetical protein
VGEHGTRSVREAGNLNVIVLATTRVGGFGVALLGLSYLVGGFEGPAVEGPLLTRVEAFSALTGILVVLGALVWQARGQS